MYKTRKHLVSVEYSVLLLLSLLLLDCSRHLIGNLTEIRLRSNQPIFLQFNMMSFIEPTMLS